MGFLQPFENLFVRIFRLGKKKNFKLQYRYKSNLMRWTSLISICDFFFSLRPSTNLTSALLLHPLQTSGMPRASIVLPSHPTDPPSPRNLLSRNRDGIPFSDTFNLHTVTLSTPTLRICDALNYPLPPFHQMLKRFQIDSEGSL